MLRSFNLCRNTLKINHLIICNNKNATCTPLIRNKNISLNIDYFYQNRCIPNRINHPILVRYHTTDKNNHKTTTVKQNTVEVTLKERFKKAVKEYGTTVIIFHVSISLMSLATCYIIVSAGFDVEALFTMLGFTEDITAKLATKTGIFVAAYAIHKLFSPVRISITLASTPFIVKYLRNIGWLKKPLAAKKMQPTEIYKGP